MTSIYGISEKKLGVTIIASRWCHSCQSGDKSAVSRATEVLEQLKRWRNVGGEVSPEDVTMAISQVEFPIGRPIRQVARNQSH